jgi:Family of unknown function (DUF6516)
MSIASWQSISVKASVARLFGWHDQALEYLTTPWCVGIISNMKARELILSRIVYFESAFAELVLWRVPTPVVGSVHLFKYRLAVVANGICIIRYDNESGKGDHWHIDNRKSAYHFTTRSTDR